MQGCAGIQPQQTEAEDVPGKWGCSAGRTGGGSAACRTLLQATPHACRQGPHPRAAQAPPLMGADSLGSEPEQLGQWPGSATSLRTTKTLEFVNSRKLGADLRLPASGRPLHSHEIQAHLHTCSLGIGFLDGSGGFIGTKPLPDSPMSSPSTE